MKYYFPDWMFVSGEKSHCFSAGKNQILSNQDKLGVWRAYPTNDPPDVGGPEAAQPASAENAAARVERLEAQRKQAIDRVVATPAVKDEASRERGVKEHFDSLR
jgi:hypothetical protein